MACLRVIFERARIGRVRYIIIGAGAVGGTIGGCLAQGGHEVVLVARGAHLDALREGGLRFGTPSGTDVLPIPAVGGPGELDLRPDDVLMVATKSQDSVAVLAEWARQPVSGGAAGGVPAGLVRDSRFGNDDVHSGTFVLNQASGVMSALLFRLKVIQHSHQL
jgi:hypothetical protein